MRTFVMPSTRDERAALVADITRWCAEVLRSPTRQPNIARWMTAGMGELRQWHANWQKLIVDIRRLRAERAQKELPN